MKNVTVCVADDNQDEVIILCESLRLNNYLAIPAFTGYEAIRLCKSGGIDLLLLDIGLPDISGIEVFKILKSDPKTKDIPIIFVTAKGSTQDVALGHELGAVDYIVKPYNLPMVLVAVDMALKTLHTSAYIDSPFEFWDDPVYTDPVTGLRNYRYLLERLSEELHRTERYKIPLSCLMLDFTESNLESEAELPIFEEDTFLMNVAVKLKNSSRGSDILTRYESTKFVALLPNQTIDGAVRYAEKIKAEIDKDIIQPNSLPILPKFGLISCKDRVVSDTEELLGLLSQNLLKALTFPDITLYGHDLTEQKEVYF